MSSIKTYRDLIVWQQSRDLAVEIYRITGSFPKSEMFGLTNQMRRAAVSVPSNIAEGYAKRTRAEYLRGLNIAAGSLAELSTQMEIAATVGLLANTTDVQDRSRLIDRLLSGLIRKLKETAV